MLSFLCNNVETSSWDATTHTKGNEEKLRGKPKKVASHEKAKGRNLRGYRTDLDEHDDINIWVRKGLTKR